MKLAKSLTTVTSLSKLLAMFLFILFPFIGFYLGILYHKSSSPSLDNSPIFKPGITATSPTEVNNIFIFIKEGTSDTQINKLAQSLKALTGVINLKVVTQTDALAIYKEKNKNNPELIQNVTSDLFPASIDVTAAHISAKSAIVTFAKSQAIVSNVVSK